MKRLIPFLLAIICIAFAADATRWVIADRDLTIWGDDNYSNRLGLEHAGYEFEEIGREGSKIIFMYNGQKAYVAEYCCKQLPDPVPAPQPQEEATTEQARTPAATTAATTPDEDAFNRILENALSRPAELAFLAVILLVVGVIGIGGAMYLYKKYSNWNDNRFHTPYNNYSAFPYLLSAFLMYVSPIFSPIYLFWWLPKLEAMLLYDRSRRYWGTTILSLLNIAAVSWGIGILASGILTPFLGIPAGFLVLFWLTVKYGEDQAYKCPACGGVDNTQCLGEFDGGIETVESNDVNTRREDRTNGFDDITIRTRRKDYYQRKVRIFACGDCHHQWNRTRRGQHLGADITKKTEIEENRLV